MKRLESLRQNVRELYEEKQPGRSDWNEWIYANHVFVVADTAKRLAEKYGANAELAEAAGMLHDIADIRMGRDNPQHETESLHIARELMQKHGYTPEEVALVVDDAIRYHSCHGDERPKSLEGRILATADALAHFQTGFYVYALSALGKEMDVNEIKDWTLRKIDRDRNNKIAFDDERALIEHDYEFIKDLFSR